MEETKRRENKVSGGSNIISVLLALITNKIGVIIKNLT